MHRLLKVHGHHTQEQSQNQETIQGFIVTKEMLQSLQSTQEFIDTKVP